MVRGLMGIIIIISTDSEMSRYKVQRENIFSNKSYEETCAFLKENPGIDLSQIRDDKGNTAIHQCAFDNQLKKMKKYLEAHERFLCRSDFQNPQTCMKTFIDSRNNDGLTPIHFAAFKGHFKILQEMQRRSADIKAVTPSLQNVLHLAAQGDKAETFIFFESAFDINCPDSKKSTPLHWASYMNSESIVTYLLAQSNIKVDPLDEDEQTPLHLATAYGNTKIVKRLLRAGADRTIVNKKGQTALKIAIDNQFTNIQRLLDDRYTCFDKLKLFLNVKTKYAPQSGSYARPLFFVIYLLFLCFFRFFFFHQNPKISWLRYVEAGFCAFVLILYVSLLTKPKEKKAGTYLDFLQKNTKLKKVCLICIREKTPRSFHCDICKTCVDRYDHHCFWINNCVGKYNLRRFLVFIILLELFFIYSIVSGVLLILRSSLIIHLRPGMPGLLNYVFQVILIGPAVIFVIPVFLLVFVQCKNAFLNRTTYQRFSKNAGNRIAEQNSHLVISNFDQKNKKKARLRNCSVMCCGKEDTDVGQSTAESLLESS